MSIPSVEKIHLYQTLRLDRSLLAGSFVDLTIRPEPLNLEESYKLGMQTSLQIAMARKLSRGSNPGTRSSNKQLELTGSELRSVIQNVFGLEEEPFVDFLVGNSIS